MQRKIIVSTILIAIFLGIGSGIAAYLVATKPQPVKINLNEPPVLVNAITVNPLTVIEPIIGYGTAKADRYARISAQVPGEVVELVNNLKVGDKVLAGQPIIRIDTKEYQHILEQANSALESVSAQLKVLDVEAQNLDHLMDIAKEELAIAQREYKRIKDLVDRKMAHNREYDLTQLALEKTKRTLLALENEKSVIPEKRAQLIAEQRNRQAEIKLAQLNLDRCEIVAPFDGRVDSLNVEVGERVNIGHYLISILDPESIEIPIELPASARQRVRVNSQCRLTVDSMSGKEWFGRVKRIAPSANELTRTFKLFVEVNNTEQEQELVPGFFVRAHIEGPTLENVMVVPRGAVKNQSVFVHKDNKAFTRNIKIKRHLRDQSIVAGLEEGSIVITSNLDTLFDGAPVRLGNVASDIEWKTAVNPNQSSLTDIK